MSPLKWMLPALCSAVILAAVLPAPALANSAVMDVKEAVGLRVISCSSARCGYSSVNVACGVMAKNSADFSDTTYTGLSMDLNQGAGGKYTYLCAVKRPYADVNLMLWNVRSQHSYETQWCTGSYPNQWCSYYYHLDSCQWPGYPVNNPALNWANLNEGAGGADVQLCFTQLMAATGSAPIRAIAAGASSSVSDATSQCKSALSPYASASLRTVVLSETQDGTWGSTDDMNRGAGGDYIVLCYGSPVITLSACPSDLSGYRGQNGRVFTCDCGSNAYSSAGNVWGTGTYLDSSSLCTAARHAGKLLPFGSSYYINAEIVAGQASYTGSTQNGVSTYSWTSWPGSFRFR